MALSKESDDMYELVIRALVHYYNRTKELSEKLPTNHDFTIPDNIGTIIADDLKSDLNHINTFQKDIKKYKESVLDSSRLPALINSRKELVKNSIESYILYLKKSKELIRESLNISELKLKSLDEEIELADKAHTKFCE